MHPYDLAFLGDDRELDGWSKMQQYNAGAGSATPMNQLRPKVDSVASLNDIAERDAWKNPKQMSYAPAYNQAPERSTYVPQGHMQFREHVNNEPLRSLSLNHLPYGHPADRNSQRMPPPQQQKMYAPRQREQRRVSFDGDYPPPMHEQFYGNQENAGMQISPRVLMHASRMAAEREHMEARPGNEDQEHITISFKPQVPLVKGETVKLVLTDFEGPDANNFVVQCKPAGVFGQACWVDEDKQLELVLGANVDMFEPVTIIVPAAAGIRRIAPAPVALKAKGGPPAPALAAPPRPALKAPPPEAPALIVPPPTAIEKALSIPPPTAVVEQEAAASPPASGGMEIPVLPTSPDEETKRKMRAEERRRQFLLFSEPEVPSASPTPSPDKQKQQQLLLQGEPMSIPPSIPVTPPRPEPEEDEVFDEIPALEEEADPMPGHGMTQAQWARQKLDQRPDKVQRTSYDPSAVAAQSAWAKEQLDNLPQHQGVQPFDADSVAEQAKWAKEQLDNRTEQQTPSKFDASSVAQQAKWAKEQLDNRTEQQTPSKFDASSVAQQAKWAKEQLDNRTEQQTPSKFDASSVAQQAKWAKQQLDLLPQVEAEESSLVLAERRPTEEERKQVMFNALLDMPEVKGEA